MHNFSFPVNMCNYINIEYWPKYSFNINLFKPININQMFDKIQMILMMKTSIWNNRISWLNYCSFKITWTACLILLRSIISIIQKQPSEVFFKKRCSSNFRKTHTKIPVPESLFKKVAGARPVTLLKRETLSQVFPCEFCKISKNTFFTEHLRVTASVFCI